MDKLLIIGLRGLVVALVGLVITFVSLTYSLVLGQLPPNLGMNIGMCVLMPGVVISAVCLAASVFSKKF